MLTRTERMLVLLAQQGDREALNSLLEHVQERLFRYIRGVMASDANDAEDVLQETLLRIGRKLGWLNEPRAFEAWIYRIASREAYRALRRAHYRLEEKEIDEDVPAPAPILPVLQAEELRVMIADLSPASRAVLLLHYQEEQPLEEIARVLSIPLGTVKSRLAYGLKCLKERVER